MYENIRFAEKVICKADNIVESFRGMRPAVKNIIQKHGEKVIDAVIDSVITVSDDAEKGLFDAGKHPYGENLKLSCGVMPFDRLSATPFLWYNTKQNRKEDQS